MTDVDFPSVHERAAVTPAGESRTPSSTDAIRLRVLVENHYDFVWRSLRYLGLGDEDAEDGAQQVMCVLARRLADVRPGVERPFLFSTATNVATTFRRTQRRRPETGIDDFEAMAEEVPGGDELVDERRAHEALQRVIQAIPEELRLVFVLYELEELTSPEIATMIGIPLGTVASRLRRAREAFHAIVQRLQAAQRSKGDGR